MKTYKKLKFVGFSNIESWSASFLFGTINKFNRKYRVLKISQLLVKNNESIIIEDEKLYKRVTVKINANGVVLRDEEYGKNIGTKRQFIAKEGQMIVSKIDARNGAFGLIPSELDGAIVTNDFPLFDINHHLVNKNYLILLAKTNLFVDFAKSCSSGTTNRQRMDIDKFLTLEIPLPSISEQETIVKKYYDKITQATTYEQQAETLEKNIESYLFESLGIEELDKRKKIGLNIIESKRMERWDIPFLMGESSLKSKYSIHRMGEYIVEIATGTTPPTSRKEYFRGDINFYTPSDINNKILLNADRKVSLLAVKDKKVRVFKKNTLLFVGIGSTVGKVGIIGNEFATSNQQITGFNVDENMLLTEYVYYYFTYFKNVTTKEQTKATLPIVNQEKIMNILIPIPPKETQRAIINQIDTYKNEIKILRERATLLRQQAEQEFEQTIFS